MLALAMAAIRTGFRALPRECKTFESNEGTSDVRGPMGQLFIVDFSSRLSAKPVDMSMPIHVEYRGRAVLEGDWVVRFGASSPVTLRAEFDPRLKELAARAKRLGLEVSDEDGRLLRLVVLADQGDVRPVLLTIESGKERDERALVRLSSELLVSSTPKSRLRKQKPKPASTMPKDFFLGLLKEQLTAGADWRFGLSADGEKLYIFSDHSLDRLDDSEFQKWILEVGRRASNGLVVPIR
jgi:hypothetical protein